MPGPAGTTALVTGGGSGIGGAALPVDGGFLAR